MKVGKATIVRALQALAQAQTNRYRAQAFRRAADALRSVPEEHLRQLSLRELEKLPGVGRSSAQVVWELLQEGSSTRYEKEVRLPLDCDLLELRGVGLGTARMLVKRGIRTITQLKEALESGKLEHPTLKKSVELWARYKNRIPWWRAHEVLVWLTAQLPRLSDFIPCGSYRRLASTVGDLDIVVPPGAIKYIQRRLGNAWIEEAAGERRLSGTLQLEGLKLHIDFLEVPGKELAAAVLYLTGSRAFNVVMRRRAKSLGYKLNEKGIVLPSGRFHHLKDEQEAFVLLDWPYVPPEAREFGNDDEIERPPDWKRVANYDFHVHSTFSDGEWNLDELKALPVKLLGVSDHSRPHAQGVRPEKFAQYVRAVRARGFLVGLEVEVLKGGRIKPEVDLTKLDYVVLSAHYRRESILEVADLLRRPEFERLPVVLAHLSGRRVGHRDGVDEDKLIRLLEELQAYRHRVVIEVNAQPDRLDPPMRVLRKAVALGYGVVLSSDFHRGDRSTYRLLRYVAQRRAQRGLVRKANLIKGLKVIKGG